MALRFIFNPFPPNPFKIPSPSRTLVCSFNPNSSSSTSPRKRISAKIPARDRIIHFGKHKGKMLGTLPSHYLKWVSKKFINEDSKEWGKLADEVLEDPVYRDRIEWEFAEAVMTGDRVAAIRKRDEEPNDSLREISERFGWDFDDKFGWGRINFGLLGTSNGGRIPRKGSSSDDGKMGSLSEESKIHGGRKLGSLSKRGSSKVPVESDEVMEERVRGSREERRERRRLKQMNQVKVVEEISASGLKKKKEEDEYVRVESITPSKLISELTKKQKLFPGRESLIKKAMSKKRMVIEGH